MDKGENNSGSFAFTTMFSTLIKTTFSLICLVCKLKNFQLALGWNISFGKGKVNHKDYSLFFFAGTCINPFPNNKF